MIHKGRANSKTNESSKLQLHNKDSLASFDPTRTNANPDIMHDLAPVRSSPSIKTIEEVPPLQEKKRGGTFESVQGALKAKHTSDIIGRLIEDLPVDSVIEMDDDDGAVQFGDVKRMETGESSPIEDENMESVHEQ